MREYFNGINRAVTRAKAKYFVLVVGLMQKEAAEMLGVSEKTISKWSKADKWKEQAEAMASETTGKFSQINGFLEYLQVNEYEKYKDIEECIISYRKLFKKKFKLG